MFVCVIEAFFSVLLLFGLEFILHRFILFVERKKKVKQQRLIVYIYTSVRIGREIETKGANCGGVSETDLSRELALSCGCYNGERVWRE